MKRLIKKIARLTIVICFAFGGLTACGDEGEEIFDNAADIEAELEKDEEDEKKSKPS